jgi:hypothetical protein
MGMMVPVLREQVTNKAMIYFAKSNYLLDYHKQNFPVLEKALTILNQHNTLLSVKNSKEPVDRDQTNILEIVLKQIMDGMSETEKGRFRKFCDDFDVTVKDGEKPTEQLERHILRLKIFQSFEGKINFGPLLEVFNYEKEIYSDKMFRFSLLSSLDKKLIPEFMSAAFAHLYFHRCIHNNVRRPLEQYFISLMASMNYHNFSSGAQFRELVAHFFKDVPAKLYVLGAVPENFMKTDGKNIKEREYGNILCQRIDVALEIKKYTTKYNFLNIQPPNLNLFVPKSLNQQLVNNFHKICNDADFIHLSTSPHLEDTESTTCENVRLVMEDFYGVTDTMSPKWELKSNKITLIMVTSTFHIYKTALEVERFFFRQNIASKHKPFNVVIIGEESVYELVSHIEDQINQPKNKDNTDLKNSIGVIRKKKIKDFMFEIFEHALDKNSNI